MKLTQLLFLYTLPAYINAFWRSRFKTSTKPSKIKQFPYQVGFIIRVLNSPGTFVCGGSLLTPTTILTAAHCFNSTDDEVTLVLGANKLYLDGIQIAASEIIIHPDWNSTTHQMDLAIVHLPPNSFNLSDTIQTIRLPRGSELSNTFAGEIADVSGYGITHDGLSITLYQELNEVSVAIMPNSECRKKYSEKVFTDANMCTSKHDLTGTCTGDSGGPLVVHRNGEPVLVGVVSYGDKICEKDRPDVYTRVTSNIDWIKNNTTP